MRKQLVVLAIMFATLLCTLTAWGAPFNATGPMTTARDSHTATAIAGGKVLVAGGWSGTSAAGTTEVFDSGAETWSSGGNLQASRAYHTATLLADGKVLLVGGFTGSGSLRTAEIYDPVAGTSTATGSMATARYYHTATPLADGKVMIAGGTGNGSSALDSVEVYDPSTGTFAGLTFLACDGNPDPFQMICVPMTPTMSSGRYNHTATRLANGSVLLAGGTNSSGTALNTVEIVTIGMWIDWGAGFGVGFLSMVHSRHNDISEDTTGCHLVAKW